MATLVDPCPAASGPSSVCDMFGSARDPMMPCRMFGEDPPAGRPHQGIDLSAPEGTPVVAAHSGYATVGTGSSGAGLGITVASVTVSTFYCHLSRYATMGGFVAQGEIIGYVGQTGNATGPHLHFEVYNAFGVPVDPLDYVRTTNPGGEVIDPPHVDDGVFAEVLARVQAMDCAGRRSWLEAQGKSVPYYIGDAEHQRQAAAALAGVHSSQVTESQASRFLRLFTQCPGLTAEGLPDVTPWGGIAGAIIPGWSGIGTPIESVTDFLQLLASGRTWVRVAYILGGAAVGYLGLRWVGGTLGVNVPLPRRPKPARPVPVEVVG